MGKKSFVRGILIRGKRVSNRRVLGRVGSRESLSYSLDSTNLEIFLENLEENVIIIAVTFDEASLK